jgi:predicted esterase
MLDRMFIWWSVPSIGIITLLRAPGCGRQQRRLFWFHQVVAMILLSTYLLCRMKYSRNFVDRQQFLGGQSREFKRFGCKMLHHRPATRCRRRILAFPGLGISVRRMLQEPVMGPFLSDSEVLCFQCRGLGESDRVLDLNARSMLDDGLNALRVLHETLDPDVRTIFVGYSLGCFVSMQLLSHPLGGGCEHAVLVNGMCNGDFTVLHFRVFARLLNATVDRHVAGSRVPVTLLHAEDDVTIPIQEAEEMIRICAEVGRPARLLKCAGDHSEYQLSDEHKKVLLGL